MISIELTRLTFSPTLRWRGDRVEPIVVRETELDGFAEVDAIDEDLTGWLRRRQRRRHLRCCGEVMHVDTNRDEGALAFFPEAALTALQVTLATERGKVIDRPGPLSSVN
jgi:hypothetical protein